MNPIHRITRWALPLLATVVVALGLTAGVLANGGTGLPYWGGNGDQGLKSGPLGLNSTLDTGQLPVAISIPDAEVDAEVEQQEIVAGQMVDPSGPWVVSWYRGTGLIGARGNAVMAGHVDYWGVGPSVFKDVADLQPGAQITVMGEDGTTYLYQVEYVERIELATLTAERLNSPEIVGMTDYPALTLVTCGGDFNGQEYLSRDVIRARLVSSEATDGTVKVQPGANQESATTNNATSDDDAQAASASGGELAEGATATVNRGGVNLRPSAGTGESPVMQLSGGEVVTITGGSEQAEGYTWWPIRLEDGTEGWIVGDFLTPNP